MSWTIREFFAAFSKGYSMTAAGKFYSCGSRKDLDDPEEILTRLTAEAVNGDELSTQALAEAMCRRMTK